MLRVFIFLIISDVNTPEGGATGVLSNRTVVEHPGYRPNMADSGSLAWP